MYTIVWRYKVKPEAVDAFERHYHAEGSWVTLFRSSPGYIRTDLFRDTAQPHVYLTCDVWESEAAFIALDAQNNTAYQALDQTCAGLTLHEEKLGAIST